jgi:splicing factor 3B subunit 3
LPGIPESVCLIEMKNTGNVGSLGIDETQLFLHVGLNNGVLLRTAVDSVTGVLSDSRTRFLGIFYSLNKTF